MSGQANGLWPALERAGLRLASGPYGLAVWLRNGLYERGWKERHQAPVPVVSVGNLTVGGTGKTPCVEYVARFYRGRDRRVAILSRGYGSPSPLPLSPGGRGVGVRGRNDEAMVLEENLPDVPHLQGPDRVALAATAVEELESEVLVLDDGFQHRRLRRDLDIVLLDATDPWGHGHLLPRGLLREPPSSLRRACVVVLTRCDQVGAEERSRLRSAIARLAPQAPLVEATHRPIGLGDGAAGSCAAGTFGRPAGGRLLRYRQSGGLSSHPPRPGSDHRRLSHVSRSSRLRAGRCGGPAPGRGSRQWIALWSRPKRTWSSCV